MNIKLRRDFKNLEDGEECLICVKDDKFGSIWYKIGYWEKETPFSFGDVEGEGEGFYAIETDICDCEVLQKQENILGFLKLREIEVE